MGNVVSSATISTASAVAGLGSYVAELDALAYERSLGNSRFMKTIRCKHTKGNGSVVVKIFVKPDIFVIQQQQQQSSSSPSSNTPYSLGNTPATSTSNRIELSQHPSLYSIDQEELQQHPSQPQTQQQQQQQPIPSLSLKRYLTTLLAEKTALQHCVNVLHYQRIVETDRAGYLVREHVYANLYDRISTRPFLNNLDKKWITFQLLVGLAEAHSRKVLHGDIKTENVLVTTWNWAYLSDWASFKPTLLPEDNPSDFAFFFDTSARRSCYLAPERFYRPAQQNRDSKTTTTPPTLPTTPNTKLTPAMDIFSLGCVIAELYLEGTPLFTFSQLLRYRAHEYDPTTTLSTIEDESIRSLISNMIQLDPSRRLSAEQYLLKYRGGVFPECFYSFMHTCMAVLSDPVAVFSVPFPSIEGVGGSGSNTSLGFSHRVFSSSSSSSSSSSKIPSNDIIYDVVTTTPYIIDADAKIERLWREMKRLRQLCRLSSRTELEVLYHQYSSGSSFGLPSSDKASILSCLSEQDKSIAMDTSTLFISILLSQLRNCRYPSNRLHALDMILIFGLHCPDEVKLDRIVPYLIACAHDEFARVRVTVMYVLTTLLSSVTKLSPVDMHIFPEFILPALKKFTNDKDILCRMAWAGCVATIAETALVFWELGMLVRLEFSPNQQTSSSESTNGNKDSALDDETNRRRRDLLDFFQDEILTLLIDPQPVVKRALLANLPRLCRVFGQSKSNDVLLSHMITYLNDDDWQLRRAFFANMNATVGNLVGKFSLEEYILPLMIQALTDPEDFVVESVLKSLTSLSCAKLLPRRVLLELTGLIAPLMMHPNTWIRNGAIAFVDECMNGNVLSRVDVVCFVIPVVQPFLRDGVSGVMLLEDESDKRDDDDVGMKLNLCSALKTPIQRVVFEQAYFWMSKLGVGSDGGGSGKQIPIIKNTGMGIGLVSENNTESESDSQRIEKELLQKLSDIGMTEEDREKLLRMRTFFFKTCGSRIRGRGTFHRRNVSRVSQNHGGRGNLPGRMKLDENENIGDYEWGLEEEISETGYVVLKNLGVTPHTVFLTPPDYSEIAKTVRPEPAMIPSFDNQQLHTQLTRVHSDLNVRTGTSSTQSQSQSQSTVFGHARHHSDSAAHIYNHGYGYGHGRGNSSVSTSPTRLRNTGTSLAEMNMKWDTSSAITESTSIVTNNGPPFDFASTSRALMAGKTKALPSTSTITETSTVILDAQAIRASTDSSLNSIPDAAISVSTSQQNSSKQLDNSEDTQPALLKNWSIDSSDRNIRKFLEKKTYKLFPPPIAEMGPKVTSTPSSYLNLPSRLKSVRRNGSRASLMSSSSSANIGNAGSELRGWKPEGTLIARLAEHTSSINQVRLSPDHAFFVTCSNDGTAKVWDTMRLEKNVTNKARLSYRHLSGKILAACFCQQTHSVASASSDGSMHVWRVEYIPSNLTPKYGGAHTFRTIQLEDDYIVCLEHFDTETESLLVYASAKGMISGIDLRTLKPVWKVKNRAHFGRITSMTIDPHRHWLVVGTNLGVLTVWDIRFRVPLRSWTHPSRAKVNKVSVYQAGGRGKWIMIAVESGNNEVSVWDLETGECKKVWFTATSSLGARGSGSGGLCSLDYAMEPVEPPHLEDFSKYVSSSNGSTDVGSGIGSLRGGRAALTKLSVRTFATPTDSNFFITGGTDKKLRYWSLDQPERDSYVISGLQAHESSPNYYTYTQGKRAFCYETNVAVSGEASVPSSVAGDASTSTSGQSVTVPYSTTQYKPTQVFKYGHRITGTHTVGGMAGAASSPSAGMHPTSWPCLGPLDAVSDLVVSQVPYNVVVAGGRDGVVNVWK